MVQLPKAVAVVTVAVAMTIVATAVIVVNFKEHTHD